MNIFEALTQGKGRINEETMSALLRFLLNPAETHGLGDIFLQMFLEVAAKQCNEVERFQEILSQPYLAEVFLEKIYGNDTNRRAIDIEINLGVAKNGVLIEKHRILIENKIKPTAAQQYQLKEEFLLVQNHLTQNKNKNVDLTVIFLTPSGNHTDLRDEYDYLDKITLGKHKKAWLYWHEDSDNENNISNLLRRMLEQEAQSEIKVLSEYVYHSLDMFANYIESAIPQTENFSRKYSTHEIGSIIDQIEVKLSSAKYIIYKYQDASIKIVDADTREYVKAHPLLRQINDELELGINLYFQSGYAKNTRTLGQEIISSLQQRK